MIDVLMMAAWCTVIPLGTNCKPATVSAPQATLRLAVASNNEQRERGLMFVRHVPHGTGMIFAFPDGDGPRNFWMKNTVTPLDMIFVAHDGTVTAVARNVPATKPGTPDDKLATRQGNGAYVIELGAGDAARAGIVDGTHLTIPEIPSE